MRSFLRTLLPWGALTLALAACDAGSGNFSLPNIGTNTQTQASPTASSTPTPIPTSTPTPAASGCGINNLGSLAPACTPQNSNTVSTNTATNASGIAGTYQGQGHQGSSTLTITLTLDQNISGTWQDSGQGSNGPETLTVTAGSFDGTNLNFSLLSPASGTQPCFTVTSTYANGVITGRFVPDAAGCPKVKDSAKFTLTKTS